MKNQITLTRKSVQKTLIVLFVSLFTLPLFAQHPGRGHGGHHGGHGGHGGGNPTCNAHFSVHRDSILNGVIFNNHEGSGAATYAWDFGDGSTSTSLDPSHAYADTGYFYVCLTITDTIGGGCTDTYCDSIYVFNPIPRCNANFRTKPDSIANGVVFSASRRSHSSSTGTTYSWDFGDGSTSTLAKPSHTYAAAGTYYVCLTITKTTPGGTCTDTHCDSVNTDFPNHGGHPHHGHRLANTNANTATAVFYPNPMVENSNVRLENTTGNATLRIFEMTGKLVYTKSVGNGDNAITKDNLSEGLYFYTIEDGNMIVSTGKLRVY